MSRLRTGKVKFWHDTKGYAFITDDQTGDEVYTYRPLLADGETRLCNDANVEYELQKTTKGFHAINVRTI